MNTDQNKSVSSPLFWTVFTTIVAGVIVLIIEYKSGLFVSKPDNPAPPTKSESAATPQAPNSGLPPISKPSDGQVNTTVPPVEQSGIPIKADIGKIYRLFRHDPELGNQRYGQGKTLEITADVDEKYIVKSQHQPFALVLDSEERDLICIFNDEDEISGIGGLHHVTVQGRLEPSFFVSSKGVAYLELRQCTLVSKGWRLHFYLLIGVPALLILSLIIRKLLRVFTQSTPIKPDP